MLRTLAVLVMVCAVALPAAAQPHHKRGHDGWWGGRDHHHSYRRERDAASAFWGGVFGGWIGQALRPDREAQDVEGDLEPWSKAWYGYCTNKYRSFNPETGRYFGYDGEYHFCQ